MTRQITCWFGAVALFAACDAATHSSPVDAPHGDTVVLSDGGDDASTTPDLSQDMASARAIAMQLAAYERALANQAFAAAGGEQYTTASARAAFIATYGPRLAETQDGNGFVLGGRFRLTTPGEVAYDTLTTSDGQPVILTWGQGGKTLFFYEPTIIDPRDGSLYQGAIAAGTRTQPESMAAKVDLFGADVPPATLRLTGKYSLQQVQELSQLIQQQL